MNELCVLLSHQPVLFTQRHHQCTWHQVVHPSVPPLFVLIRHFFILLYYLFILALHSCSLPIVTQIRDHIPDTVNNPKPNLYPEASYANPYEIKVPVGVPPNGATGAN